MNTNYYTRWIAGFVLAAGLGTAIITGSAVAAADDGGATTTSGTTTGSVNDGVSARKLQEQVGVKINRGVPAKPATGSSVVDDWESPNV